MNRAKIVIQAAYACYIPSPGSKVWEKLSTGLWHGVADCLFGRAASNPPGILIEYLSI